MSPVVYGVICAASVVVSAGLLSAIIFHMLT